MKSRFRIVGGSVLSGRLEVSGSKNAAFPLLAASVLCSTPLTITNLPDIEDIRCFLSILSSLGARIVRPSANVAVIDSSTIDRTVILPELGSRIRGSYYLLGALLARHGSATISLPGGCDVGERPMDLHIAKLSELGYVVQDVVAESLVTGHSTGLGAGNLEINLPFPSRGATINLLLATALRNASVTIRNANRSPECVNLQRFLVSRGVLILGLGTSLVKVHGQPVIIGGTASVSPDKVEAGTMLCAGLITRGAVTVERVDVDAIHPLLIKLQEIGCQCTWTDDSATISCAEPLKPVRIVSGLQPTDLDADWEPPLAAVLSTIPGDSVVQDTINPDRHARYIDGLRKLGARITVVDGQNAIIHGGGQLTGGEVHAREIRGGAALTLAALAAKGTTVVTGVEQIDRGYERLDQKLNHLGAGVNREHY